MPVECHALEIVDRHLLVRFEGGVALLDTGSPADIGRGSEVSICGVPRWPGVEQERVLDMAGAHLGVELEWLLGFPCFSDLRVCIDWQGRMATFSTELLELRGAARIAIDLIQPVPIVVLVSDGDVHRAVLDTGAALSYVPRSATRGSTPTGMMRDFHPMIGDFETPTWRVPISIGGREIQLEAGTLPHSLERSLGRISGGWILGSDFFRDRVVVIDYLSGHVLDGPREGA